MRRVKQAFANYKRASTALMAAVVDALDAGEHLTEVSKVVGVSRETMRSRVKAERERRARADG